MEHVTQAQATVQTESQNVSATTEPLAPTGTRNCLNEAPRRAVDIPGVVLVKKLSLADKLLTPAILLAMIIGVIIGEFAPGVQSAFDTARFGSVSARTSSSPHTHPRPTNAPT